MAGEGKVKALKQDHGPGLVLNCLADLLLPLQGPDLARIPPRAVRREDQGAPVEIEQIGAGGFVRDEFHQDLIVGGHPNLFDGIGMIGIEGAGFALTGGLERLPHHIVRQVPPECPRHQQCPDNRQNDRLSHVRCLSLCRIPNSMNLSVVLPGMQNKPQPAFVVEEGESYSACASAKGNQTANAVTTRRLRVTPARRNCSGLDYSRAGR